MKIAPTVRPIDAPQRKVVTASGRRKPASPGSIPKRSRADSSIAGSAAIDERLEKATTCGGRAARAKSRSEMPPKITAAGYKTNALSRIVAATTKPIYAITAPAAEMPSFAASETASAKTPIGARARKNLTSSSIAS